MNALIEQNIDRLKDLCVRHGVKRLELFGSAVDGHFNPESSDLDFLVEFQTMTPVEHADAYFNLLENLQDLFHRMIDLVEIKAVDNPYFMDSVARTRRTIYAS